jgi:hypothetical protein
MSDVLSTTTAHVRPWLVQSRNDANPEGIVLGTVYTTCTTGTDMGVLRRV